MTTLLRCLFSPRLFYVYSRRDTPGFDYVPNVCEKISDYIIKWFRFCWSFSYWTSPFLLVILYRRGAFTQEALGSWTSYGVTLTAMFTLSMWGRAIGRCTNPQYREFLAQLSEAQNLMNRENKRKITQYDFEFFGWPIEFVAHENKRRTVIPHVPKKRDMSEKVKAIPCHILSYCAIHTFGRRMVYPGTTALLQALISSMLVQGRTKLIEEKKGIRYKLLTTDNNQIDTMFVDRRNKADFPKGSTLVICCEGNAGFYELGTMVTALDAGYSVLGWNHPGYYGSTGAPFPSQEQNAADAVMQFAMHKLGFQPYEIIVFGWSIGGYPVSWLAMNYPEISSVVVDASFDDIVPLAITRMPQSWRSLVILTMKKYMNLNIAGQLCKYPGPILLIRRSRDEMITTTDPSDRSSNRGNFILISLLKQRYPRIVTEDTIDILKLWLSKDSAGQLSLCVDHQVDSDLCNSMLSSYIEEHSSSYPLLLGDDLSLATRKCLTLFLATKYMEEYESTHCQPLPASYLHTPWTIRPLD